VNLMSLSLMHTHKAISWEMLRQKYEDSGERRPISFFLYDKSNNSFREGKFDRAFLADVSSTLKIIRKFMVYQPCVYDMVGSRIPWEK
jgi:hypothetical protein